MTVQKMLSKMLTCIPGCDISYVHGVSGSEVKGVLVVARLLQLQQFSFHFVEMLQLQSLGRKKTLLPKNFRITVRVTQKIMEKWHKTF